MIYLYSSCSPHLGTSWPNTGLMVSFGSTLTALEGFHSLQTIRLLTFDNCPGPEKKRDGLKKKEEKNVLDMYFNPILKAVVTDFNNHRLLVIKADFQGAQVRHFTFNSFPLLVFRIRFYEILSQFLGSEGTKDGEFTRPNGVTVDDEGNIIVADSRNDRIQVNFKILCFLKIQLLSQVFSSSGVFLRKFGSKGSGPGEFDRPCGVRVLTFYLFLKTSFLTGLHDP